MNTIKFDNQKTLVVAHRGLSGLERENTASAFVAAGNRNYFGIETDVYRTSDGQVVVNHDGNAQRVGGVNVAMEQAPWELLREVVLYDTDGSKDRYDLRLPNLQNYISICKKYEKVCVLELKSVFTHEEVTQIIDIINGYDYLSQVIFISFHYDNLTIIRDVIPDQPCQFLTGDNSDAMIQKLKDAHIDIDIIHTALTEERISAMHEAGLKVNCWTVDDATRAEDLASWGVDFITTNILQGIRD